MFPVVMKIHSTGITDNDVPQNSIINITGILFEKRDTDSPNKKEIFDNNSTEKTLEKTPQTYDKYCLRAKIEEIIYKNREKIRDNKTVKSGTCRTRYFSNANPMNLEKMLKNKAKYKYFIGIFPEQFNVSFDFLGESKYALDYWNTSSQRKYKCTLGNKMPLTEKEQLFTTLLRLC